MDFSTTHHKDIQKKGVLTKISIWILLIGVFLTPLIFIPSTFAPLDVVKAFFICFSVIISVLFYLIDSAKNKTIILPKSSFGYITLAVVATSIISALLSNTLGKSFIGQGFEITTTSFLLVMVLTSFLVSRIVLRDNEIVFKVYSAILISFILLALFHITRLLGGADLLSFGLLTSVTSTVIGKWYDFAAFTGLVGMLSLIVIKFLPLRAGLRRIFYFTLVVCGLLLLVINSAFIWSIVAITTLTLAVYEFTTRISKHTGLVKSILSKVSVLTVVVLLISSGLAWKGGVVANGLVDKLQADYAELLLTWRVTLDVGSETIKTAPLFGTGPNTFGQQYLLHKPNIINQTQFWNTEFTSGFGLIPTIAVTQGFVGIIVWILFIISFAKVGSQVLQRNNDPLKKFITISSFFGSLFLLVLNLVYVSSHSIVFLLAIFLGIFMASLVESGVVSERIITAKIDSRMRRLVPVVFYVSVIMLAVWLGVYVKKSIAIIQFEKGLKELNLGKSTDKAQAHFRKALMWDASDVYYQALSETNILKINALAQEIQRDTQSGNTEAQKKKADELMVLIEDSLGYTKVAQSIDPQNYYNHIAEARISEVGTLFKIPNAYENTKNAYIRAIEVNPVNPALYLNLARLEASQRKFADAQQYIGRSLQIKPNYIDAVFLLSQIQVANNQIDEAITSTTFGIQLNPQEPILHFQLGLLAYSSKDYQTAMTSFEQAISLNADYANARYFLGLTYARLGKNAEAIGHFETLEKTNPDNEEVKFILLNLRAGKSPFTDAKAPIDNKPEQRKTLPVTEKSDTTKTPSTKNGS